ncbi:hypothetical protein Acj9p136 [Acinetobacter phage Acj9]|uniref:Uncharacterized protein n=1 Tax=Acinetobacter phage Acj9 TaxID=760939 RepID=E5EPS0_9CAUD|nr:hypothetical protein Acj9p136 [Acinetobacter phage Acj9]ADG60036.1 hypothetical protein Acj9p136 [Acinetobacter phage Acj9]
MAWEQVSPQVFAVYGTKIDHSNSSITEPFAEISYSKETDSFGISFIDNNGKRNIVPQAVFNMRTCGTNTIGAISGPELVDISSRDQMENIFIDCSRPLLFRVWDNANGHVTYKFENVGPLPE